MKTVVLGSGGWGTALSQILCDNGHETYLWSHSPAKAAEMARTRENPLLQGVHLPESLHITGDLGCLRCADLVVSAPPCKEPCTVPAAPASDCISTTFTCWPNRFFFPSADHLSVTSAITEEGVMG